MKTLINFSVLVQVVILPFSFNKINVDFTAIKVDKSDQALPVCFVFTLFYLRTSHNEEDIKRWKVSKK